MKRHIFDVLAKILPIRYPRIKTTTPGSKPPMDRPGPPALVKRYAEQRLYRPATAAYLTRDDLMTMAKNGEKFVAIDAPAYHPIRVEH